MNTKIMIALLVVLVIAGCKPNNNMGACTADAKLCPDGTAVGRDANNNCEFFECNVPTEGKLKAVYCELEQRKAEACTMEYAPVCGWSDPEKIQCIRYPCAQTYGNICTACANENVAYYTVGECPSGMCTCPEGYRKEGDACNPECYYSTPRCLAPSIPCEEALK